MLLPQEEGHVTLAAPRGTNEHHSNITTPQPTDKTKRKKEKSGAAQERKTEGKEGENDTTTKKPSDSTFESSSY